MIHAKRLFVGALIVVPTVTAIVTVPVVITGALLLVLVACCVYAVGAWALRGFPFPSDEEYH